MIIPPYLKKGDCIGIVCPSGYMPAENTPKGIMALEQHGFTIKLGKTVGNQHYYFSGTDEERLDDLQMMLNDDAVKAIYFGRGGYGLSRIIDKIDFKKFKKNPKWLVGYSDITVLHAHINRNYKIATLHAPMIGAWNEYGENNAYNLSVINALKGKKADYSFAAFALNKQGHAKGELVGGNLSIVNHLIGTRSSYQTRNKILFLEDVGEYLYHIDRLFIQLKRAGLLKGLAGLVLGGFTELKDTIIPFGKDIETLLAEHLAGYDYPVCYRFPVGHTMENYALKIGQEYSLSVKAAGVRLKEG